MGGGLVPLRGYEMGGAQILELFSIAGGQNIVGTGTNGALAAADITALLVGAAPGNVGTTAGGGMAIDLSNQLNSAAVAAITGGWPAGNP
jgi:hypothetical protein